MQSDSMDGSHRGMMGFITDSHQTAMSTSTTTPSLLGEDEEGRGEREYGNFSILHVILVSFGAVVFIIGIIVIIALLKSRKKWGTGTEGASATRQSRQPPIFVIGQGNRQGRGGDNPAFCRSDEAGTSAFPSRGQRRLGEMDALTTRLPTYEEVISGRAPSAPLSRSQQRSNIRVSQLQRQRGGGAPTPTPTDTAASRGADSNPEGATAGRSETPPPRYAYEYPSCFWEEVPPPPYPSGNTGMVRAMGGGPRGSARGVVVAEGAPLPNIAAVTVHRNYSPNPGRAPLAVPTPTVLSPAPSPALLPRNHTQTSSTGSRRAVPVAAPPPSAASFLPALSGLEGTRPLASSSPAVPRRQPTPAPASAPTRHGQPVGGSGHPSLLPSQQGTGRSRSEESRGQGQGSGSTGATSSRMVVVASAPMASFDVEL